MTRQTSFTCRHPDQTTLADNDERPDDCKCTGSEIEAEGGLPCWPCYRAGFDDPNPNVTPENGIEDDTDAKDKD